MRACRMESSAVESIPPEMKRRLNSSSSSFLDGMMAQTVFSMNFTNQMRISTLQMLNVVWKADSIRGTATSVSVLPKTLCTNHVMPLVRGEKTISTQMTPNTLNIRCAMAARRACVLPVMAARLAVMVVPMFSPSTKAAPNSKEIHPLAHMMRVMAIVAADACTIMVSTVPMRTNRMTEKKPMSV